MKTHPSFDSGPGSVLDEGVEEVSGCHEWLARLRVLEAGECAEPNLGGAQHDGFGPRQAHEVWVLLVFEGALDQVQIFKLQSLHPLHNII